MGSSPTRPIGKMALLRVIFYLGCEANLCVMGTNARSKDNDGFLQRVLVGLRPYLSTQSLQSLKWVVGVSGGADSLALLHCLKRVVGPEKLIAVHVNHRLRAEADEDARFVKDTAVSWGIQYKGKEVDVAQLAAESGWSIEEAGRFARYDFFAEVVRELGATAVCVAHHADDQVETILLHLIRGSGLAGLRGMQSVGQVPGHEDVVLLRPFLRLTRAEIEAYCQTHQLQPRHDASNEDTAYFRNRIRHELLPLLHDYNPNFSAHLRQMSEIIAADYGWLDAQFQEVWHTIVIETGDGWLQVSRQAWRDLPLSQQRMALRRGILQLRPSQTEISFAAVEQARQLCAQNVSGTQMDLPGNIKLSVDYEGLIFSWQEIEPPALDVPQVATTAVLSIPGKIALEQGWHIETAVSTPNPSQIIREATPMQVFVDVGDAAELYVRGRQPGERMQPLGMNGASTKLKEMMIDRKMARPYRANWPLVTTNEHPVWLVGQMIDERVKVTAESTRIIQINCYQSSEMI